MRELDKYFKKKLSEYMLPVFDVPLKGLGTHYLSQEEEGRLILIVSLDIPCEGIRETIVSDLHRLLDGFDNGAALEICVISNIATHATRPNLKPIRGVKNVIAVASGKGGVGKSTTSVNLALALHREGAKVGLLDADIYGPSIPTMLGIDENVRPQQIGGNYIKPLIGQGIQTLSMGNLVTGDTPIVWRGPKISGALLQLYQQTAWENLDYLVIDLPPGTGDVHLTLAQQIPVTGAVIVTTPQDIALLDAKKAIEMFGKVDIPVLGVVENMSIYTCSSCGHTEHIFGDKGGQRLAESYRTTLLGALPLSISIREQMDIGNPPVIGEPEGAIAREYISVARKVALCLAKIEKSNAIPVVS